MEQIKEERKLASIRQAGEIRAIPEADIIQAVKVGGWTCVIKKGEFQTGDLGVYFEIDSLLPMNDSRFAFLKKEAMLIDGVEFVRLKTKTFKKQRAQGLFLPLNLFPELSEKKLGEDVTKELNITKWEPVLDPRLAGEVEGPFPTHLIIKTDQERIQNLTTEIEENQGELFEVTLKLDGSSMTVFKNNDYYGVCGRNWELRDTPENLLWNMTRLKKLHEALKEFNVNYALQGELMGPGIQDNIEKLSRHDFFVFDIFDLDNQQYLTPIERQEFMKKLNEAGYAIKHVPFLYETPVPLKGDSDQLLELANGKSLNPEVDREGLVWKRIDGRFSFKTISNLYLEEQERKLEKANKKSRNKMRFE